MSDVALTKSFVSDQFQFRMQPVHWARKSDDLWRSANELWSSYRSILRDADSADQHAAAHGSACIALMLLGLSIENAMKGLLIGHDVLSKEFGENLKIEDYFYSSVKSNHNLYLLWKKTSTVFGFQECKDHRRNFDRLSEYISWYARYPLPKKRTKFDDFRMHASGGRLYDAEMLFNWSFENFSFLRTNLEKMLEKLPIAELAE